MSDSLYARLGACFPRDPAKPFIETARGRIITYGELDALSGRVACTLAALGVRPGDRVAVHTEKSPEALILYLGTIRAGAVYLPLNVGYTPAELSYFVSDAEPSLVVCDPVEVVPTFYTRLLTRPDLTAEAVRHVRLFVSGSDRSPLRRTGNSRPAPAMPSSSGTA
jgi:acyl-coenzyme A synthetase/AMP-(fatty) acid ligase